MSDVLERTVRFVGSKSRVAKLNKMLSNIQNVSVGTFVIPGESNDALFVEYDTKAAANAALTWFRAPDPKGAKAFDGLAIDMFPSSDIGLKKRYLGLLEESRAGATSRPEKRKRGVEEDPVAEPEAKRIATESDVTLNAIDVAAAENDLAINTARIDQHVKQIADLESELNIGKAAYAALQQEHALDGADFKVALAQKDVAITDVQHNEAIAKHELAKIERENLMLRYKIARLGSQG